MSSGNAGGAPASPAYALTRDGAQALDAALGAFGDAFDDFDNAPLPLSETIGPDAADGFTRNRAAEYDAFELGDRISLTQLAHQFLRANTRAARRIA